VRSEGVGGLANLVRLRCIVCLGISHKKTTWLQMQFLVSADSQAIGGLLNIIGKTFLTYIGQAPAEAYAQVSRIFTFMVTSCVTL
jgi:hypothetical protein